MQILKPILSAVSVTSEMMQNAVKISTEQGDRLAGCMVEDHWVPCIKSANGECIGLRGKPLDNITSSSSYWQRTEDNTLRLVMADMVLAARKDMPYFPFLTNDLDPNLMLPVKLLYKAKPMLTAKHKSPALIGIEDKPIFLDMNKGIRLKPTDLSAIDLHLSVSGVLEDKLDIDDMSAYTNPVEIITRKFEPLDDDNIEFLSIETSAIENIISNEGWAIRAQSGQKMLTKLGLKELKKVIFSQIDIAVDTLEGTKRQLSITINLDALHLQNNMELFARQIGLTISKASKFYGGIDPIVSNIILQPTMFASDPVRKCFESALAGLPKE